MALGPERLNRRPIVDEHDFYCGRYLDANGSPREIRISAVLTELSSEAEKRFYKHLRRWNNTTRTFVDEGGSPEAGDQAGTCWCLHVLFIARYDPDADDFIANTFFDHPMQPQQENDDEEIEQRLG